MGLMAAPGMLPPGNGMPVPGMIGTPNRLCEKSPVRSASVGTLVTRVMPSRERVPS